MISFQARAASWMVLIQKGSYLMLCTKNTVWMAILFDTTASILSGDSIICIKQPVWLLTGACDDSGEDGIISKILYPV